VTASCACGATWTGTVTQHCSAYGCHQTFSSTSAGDMHRVGQPTERRCLTVEAMVSKGMRSKINGQGTFVWVGPGQRQVEFFNNLPVGSPGVQELPQNPAYSTSYDESEALTGAEGTQPLHGHIEALRFLEGEVA
jgi:hypothetical protein